MIDVATMEVREELNSLDETIIMESVYSRIDGGYIGTVEWAETLSERGIAPQRRDPSHRVCSIGFCEKEQKWYGWSHRAMFGFGVGSSVKKGDCAYIADTPEGLIDDRAEFFSDISEESAHRHRAECQILLDRSGIRILHAPMMIPVASNLAEALDYIDGEDPSDAGSMGVEDLYADAVSIIKCGRGEWTAKTLDDAKQMAMDFAESVS
jgi:hypothetical protein